MARLEKDHKFKFKELIEGHEPVKLTKNSAGYDVLSSETINMEMGKCYYVGLGISLGRFSKRLLFRVASKVRF